LDGEETAVGVEVLEAIIGTSNLLPHCSQNL
jgi:hypothetical protein